MALRGRHHLSRSLYINAKVNSTWYVLCLILQRTKHPLSVGINPLFQYLTCNKTSVDTLHSRTFSSSASPHPPNRHPRSLPRTDELKTHPLRASSSIDESNATILSRASLRRSTTTCMHIAFFTTSSRVRNLTRLRSKRIIYRKSRALFARSLPRQFQAGFDLEAVITAEIT